MTHTERAVQSAAIEYVQKRRRVTSLKQARDADAYNRAVEGRMREPMRRIRMDMEIMSAAGEQGHAWRRLKAAVEEIGR